MANKDKVATYVVVHPKLTLRTNDGLQVVPAGQSIKMSEKNAASMLASGKIAVQGSQKPLDAVKAPATDNTVTKKDGVMDKVKKALT